MEREIEGCETIEGGRKLALISMAFQLGVENVLAISPNKSKNWPRFIGYVKEAAVSKGMKRESLFKKAADEMIDSNWYKQVPNRAGRLVKRMRALADE